jgi:ribosomal protein L17
MKKSQLKQIIREEISNILDEERKNTEDFSGLVYKNMWEDLLTWAKSNRTSSRKDANYPSKRKQEKYLLSIAPKYKVDVSLLKKALKTYDAIHNRTYGMIPGGLTWQEWLDAKISK